MKPSRSILLIVSFGLVLFLLGGGLAVKVGAGENSFRQVVVFSEILSLVLDNYVDPVEAQKLLDGAYEGMLGGLDAHGAYLKPEEVRVWKAYRPEGLTDPGITVLQAGRAVQVVSVVPGSPAETAGIQVGDQIRSIDGQPVRELSLDQSWRLIQGAPSTLVKLDLLHPSDGFRREEVEVLRVAVKKASYELQVVRGIGLLRPHDLRRLDRESLAQELEDISSRGVRHLLIDLRNVADYQPRDAARAAELFFSGPLLNLRDRAGELSEVVEGDSQARTWKGEVSVLVNGATAGSAEALASVIHFERGGLVLGERTYGLGAEARLYEMGDGSGLLVSSALWETPSGGSWNGEGLEPDELIRGKGQEYAERFADQLERALNFLEDRLRPAEGVREAA